MGHYAKVFAVTENGNEVFRGTAKEIENWNYMITRDLIYNYTYSERRVFGIYKITHVGEKLITPKKDQKKKENKGSKHEQALEWIRIALKQPPYYMTSYHTNGKEFADELKAEGILFTAEKCPYKKGHYYLKRV